MIKIGIVGLPNVGKSSLFKLLTKLEVLIANYPFATIDHNSAIINLTDNRLEKLQKIYDAKKIVQANVEFVDIAGIVKGASKGEGLGNQFLSNIQEVDAICHVVRLFINELIIHVDKKPHPLNDLKIVNEELILKDIITLENHIPRMKKRNIVVKNKEVIEELIVLEKALVITQTVNFLNSQKWNSREVGILKKYGLLTIKPCFILINIDESQILSLKTNDDYLQLINYLENLKWEWFVIPIKFLFEINELPSEEEKEIFLDSYQELQIFESDFLHFLTTVLQINIFFTCGENEVHAWHFKSSLNIKQVAGIIHTDLSSNFICANVFNYSCYKNYNSEKNLKEAGLIKNVGKDYIVKDGDIINIIHSAKKR